MKAHFNVLKQVSKKKQIWNTIAADMEAMGYKRDGPACASKYRSLVSQYKICKDLNKRSGNAKITYQQMGTIDEMLGENESTEPEFLFSLGVQTSVDKNVLLSESEKNNLSAPKTSAPKETLAAKKRAVVDEDSAHPEAPFVQGPQMNRKERRELEQSLRQSNSQLSDESAVFPTAAKQSSAEKASHLFAEKLSTFEKNMDEKMENEKHRAASDEHRREQKNDMRFHQMMQFQAQQTNAMLKMMAVVMNPAIAPEQLSVFKV